MLLAILIYNTWSHSFRFTLAATKRNQNKITYIHTRTYTRKNSNSTEQMGDCNEIICQLFLNKKKLHFIFLS